MAGPPLGTPAAAAIDAAWLGEALARAGVGAHTALVGIDAASIGTGQMGESVRFRLHWRDPDGLPDTVVGKFPSPDPGSRSAGASGAYAREIGFYRDLQARAGVPTPEPLYLAYDGATADFVVIMGDVHPAVQGDQLAGCGLAEARLAVDAIVGLHAATWGRVDELVALGWLPGPTPELLATRVAMYAELFGGFEPEFTGRLGPDDIELGRWIGAHLAEIHESHAVPRCAAHNDFRLDNLLFATGAGPEPVTVVDWQTIGIGHGPVDIAYFVGAGVWPAPTVDEERVLVDRYGARLAERGVDADPDDLWTSYRLGAVSGYVMAVVASQLVVKTERGEEMFTAMASRHAAQVRRLGVTDLVG